MGAIDFEAFLIDGQDVVPAFAKTVRHDFLERTFVLERRVWLPIPAGAEHARLRVRIGGYNARLSLNGKQEADGHLIGKICQHFLARGRALKQAPWLLMDRDTQADDNAEHLYRHIRHCHPEQPMAFMLRRESHDWPRLAQDGFNLLAYGSREHEDALRTCGKIISSHADEHVVDYFKDGLLSTKPFVFLQHGIIKDDLSGWLNQKKRIDCFVTTTQPEFESIAGDFSRYKVTRKEVVLSGLPRHDALLAPDVPGERLIVIMPTWRQALAGRQVGASSERELSPEFMSSEYALAWKSVLHNPALRVLTQDTGFKVLFFPHANVQPYLADFAVPPYIEVMTHAEGSMQTLFRRAALMVTDYSSVAFELALLRKAVLYYQFDEAAVFGGEHTYQKGYFDYRADGFGPVVVDELALFAELAHLLTSDARPAPDYLARMEAFFPFRDGGNCERVYRAIKALDEPMPEGFVDTEILLAYAKAASRAEAWNLAESRWRHYLQVAADVGLAERLDAQLNLAIALINSRRLPYAAKCLLEAVASGCQDHGADESFIRRVDSAFIDLYVVLGDWDKALSLFQKAVGSSDSDAMLVWLRQQRIAGVLELRDRCLLCLAKNDWQQLALMLEEEADSNSMDPELESLLLRAFREVGWSS